jgi:6-phosphogluconolactonase
VRVEVLPDPEAAAVAAAAWLASRIRRAVSARGRADIAVSGGTTPALMFSELARRDLPWTSVHVHQVDERIVPADHPARNAAQLEVMSIAGANVHLLPIGTRGVLQVELPERFDVVHLGLGDDGHTASWPPGTDVSRLRRTGSPPVVRVDAFRGHDRVTLTPAVVNRARTRLVLVTGAAKATVLRQWMDGERDLPISAVVRRSTTVIADRAAAGHRDGGPA